MKLCDISSTPHLCAATKTGPSPQKAGPYLRERSLKAALANHQAAAAKQSLASPRLSEIVKTIQSSLAGGLLTAALVQAPHVLAAEVIRGPARVVDGDTLEIAGIKIRLYGIDAPETKQSCRNAQGQDYACGEESTASIKKFVGGSDLSCEVKNRDMYGRSVAACHLAARPGKDGDVNDWMVANGHALAYRQYSKEYIGDEERAKARKAGIWAGDFQLPWEYRKEKKQGKASSPAALPPGRPAVAALPGASSSPGKMQQQPSPQCAIKGNISANGDRLYHIPGSRSYTSTVIDEKSGERWFCSEQDAQKAGWRAPKA
ncbi:hypothetical protein WJX74_006365 [Apatococcus lobatus]|uniref:TNase-like domain-containing protein n=1 Tax=Apatococcus lobatus TaxID=904363 RepID=A0AAW1RI94_9CHLO